MSLAAFKDLAIGQCFKVVPDGMYTWIKTSHQSYGANCEIIDDHLSVACSDPEDSVEIVPDPREEVIP